MSLDLTMFTTDLSTAKCAIAAGIDRVIVDWETAGKEARQSGYSTQINFDSPEHVRVLAEHGLPVLVRIDHLNQNQVEEDIEIAIDCGANSIILPMATTVDQVDHFVKAVNDRVRSVVQIETQQLVDDIASLKQIGWDTAYIGLNDLMISRGATWIWRPILDGTVERIFELLEGRKIGFGGVTTIGRGEPIPFTALFSEMARLGCAMSFLCRSFVADIPGRDVAAEITAIRSLWNALARRGPEAVAEDHERFIRRLVRLDPVQRICKKPIEKAPASTSRGQ